MGEHPEEEVRAAFEEFLRVGAYGRDWKAWASLFTEDATYIEHLYGTLGGREAIRTWITTTMAQPVNRDMRYFPIEWYVIDEERGWVVCQVWNRMVDPGDGSLHQAYNFTLLKYAGDNLWSYEEDVYNPAHFKDMVVGWLQRREALAAEGGDGD